ncbi:hypothetical protein ACVWXM_007461 [Bradyrhizobium sp. GM7.3]
MSQQRNCSLSRSCVMRHAPSIVPLDRLDRDVYLVLEDFGARAGCSWRETDEQDTDRETVLRDLISGQYAYPVRIVVFNAIEGWSRDATGEVADELGERAAGNTEITPALRAFIEANATRPFAVQLALPLRGVA